MLTFNIVSLFPEFFDSPLSTGLMGKARASGLVKFNFINPRDYSADKHRRVDDRPFGGGAGMLLRLEPLTAALRSITDPGAFILLAAQGEPFRQKDARRLARERTATLICGRYEGIDARLQDLFPIRSLSVCDAALNGGETAALAIIEATARLIPGFMGKESSADEESFANGLLEYPQYTRPETFEGLSAPPELLSGDHAAIAGRRRELSLAETLANRPDLLARARLTAADAKFLKTVPRRRAGRNLSFCLCHWPVFLENGETGSSSLTNLDLHDIARISRGYGMGPFFVLSPLASQTEVLLRILRDWEKREGDARRDRRDALSLVRPARDFAEVDAMAREYYGRKPLYAISSARFPRDLKSGPVLTVDKLRAISERRPVIVCLGTARGLDASKLPFKFVVLRPVRFLDENHLSVRGAAAIIADRIIGDFY